ncbi:bifunctional biotin--[acetyl-CoA-carboxylase] ligase/biotin operon repressor BirA [Shewanella sp. D64]|uniref:bifunctional biotin--[acetyl-CoA-carboxylase] ligase/biotin operon repressor BirA n=1 Tax=unclassified Shewanella TaxID=196818 RepID=UPI0022BA5D94|nr:MULTISPECIES: bifunctional biotin--[acetyl-CoA-carboxylase] ligase/biotin operon repressor BirA [unclassified Shewanella]MEC4729079.1 bifunctional biotin--[acetyl-CoA-carboxylase] ligase/biotin operon repressor BirA [Shewanella sp. D64]MEC4740891.1 bifunctional biotin--[acetyl-CoA-carboxylase] ligase/biotin operon repressor BirA [Shewanella sp. E94]WBJ95281.1 bifunctional biotin--[acetyl-CoA-carboxylase] ligase/biotin operon repressor BirA [Shewanella sp. MTB7]
MVEQWQRKRDILLALSAEHFVSGESLASLLGVSRTAISNHISTLEEYGVDIFSVKGKGYKLANSLSLIDEAQLKRSIAQRCFYYDEIQSTNAFLLKHCEELSSGDICIAEYQSAGRGRRGRTWVSPYGCHLYCSMYWNLPQGMAQATGLSLVVACSLVKVLNGFNIEELGVKWPNDIYLDNKKLAGVLVEMNGQAGTECNLVIGIGINMSMSKTQGDKIDQPWSDLSQSQSLPTKTELAISLQHQLYNDLILFEKEGLSAFLTRWKQVDIFDGEVVKLLMGDKCINGICKGIDETGSILLKTDKGIESFVGGEISLRSVI